MVTTGLLRHATYICMLWRSTGGWMLEKDGETHTQMEEDMQESAFCTGTATQATVPAAPDARLNN